ncbi:hypothetical protein D0866_12358 [Hortaea werneckii]|uniref:Major facilitator superfamily (MFS) profile domain-containing protein n=1 Tax=Hortaea werneckii TaxID=91943 RepID=A0A3M7A107_HORWE|nr:hypothetical protein D0866_12358 [Hortaea werneckii]
MHQIDNLEMKAMSATPEESTTADIENGQMQHFGPHDGKSHGINTADVLPGSDVAYEKEISILNEALISLGMNSFQWKIIFMTGFGWFLWMQAITIRSPPVQREFAVQRISMIIVAKYVGLVLRSSFWPMTADIICRRTAFNITLVISGVAGLIGAGSPDFVAIAMFCAFIGFGSGGDQPVDSAIFLEYIPATHQYLLVMKSAFWSVGQAVAALIAWPLIANFSCAEGSEGEECGYHDNLGWRYTLWVFGGITTIMWIARFPFRLYETPKYLLGSGKNEKTATVVQNVARRDGKDTWLTAAHFNNVDAQMLQGEPKSPNLENTADVAAARLSRNAFRSSLSKFAPHSLKGLFATLRTAVSTTLMLILWASIGMAYPLYTGFIPFYLEQKGVSTGNGRISQTYRNYAVRAVCGIPASIIGGYSVELKAVGRKGTGALACICTGVFPFLYTRARSSAGVLGFSCAIAFFQNLTYGLLHSYTPELFPAPVRGTGNGLVALLNRLSGLMAPIVVAYTGIETGNPIWISAALFIAAGFVFVALPYESRGRAAA